MKKMIVLACLGFAFTASVPALAAGERMKACSREATGMKGDERKAFMKKCLSKDYVLKPDVVTEVHAGADKPAASAAAAASPAQQDKMKACNADARAKGLMGEERKKFMSACLKG